MENRIPLQTYFDSLLQRVELQIQDYEDNAGDPLTLCGHSAWTTCKKPSAN